MSMKTIWFLSIRNAMRVALVDNGLWIKTRVWFLSIIDEIGEQIIPQGKINGRRRQGEANIGFSIAD
jgi:hypothetical protein